MRAEYLDAVPPIDDKGAILFNSQQGKTDAWPNLADRDYVTVHRDSPVVGFFVSSPYRSRLARADGGFAGVALAVIRVDAWRDLFDRIIPGKNGSMTPALLDGLKKHRRQAERAALESETPYIMMVAPPSTTMTCPLT